jgi:hypothetical protein
MCEVPVFSAQVPVRKSHPRMLADIAPLLDRLRRDGEELLHTFVACSPASLGERIVLGSGVQHLRLGVIAVTTQRLVFIAVTRHLRPRGSVSQIWWGDVKSVRVSTIRRTVVITFRNGRTQRLTDLAFGDASKLATILRDLPGTGLPTSAKEREPLCAACLAPLRPNVTSCANCHMRMKRRGHATKLAWWSAGGGYHYLGFPHMAMLAGMIEIAFLGIFVFALAHAITSHGLAGSIAAICTLIVFIEWKALVVSHTASLANELIVDATPPRDGSETLLEVIDDAMQWIYRPRRTN